MMGPRFREELEMRLTMPTRGTLPAGLTEMTVPPAVRRFGPALLAAVVSLVGCNRLANHPIVPVAREEVSKNPRVVDLLAGPGGTVQCGSAVTGRASDTDGVATLQFEARGPRGQGTVVVEGKKVGAEWGVTRLELQPAGGGEHLVLTADLEARTGVDTPKFDPTAAAKSTAPAPPPPTDIEIALPPGAPQ
jgi:hypothetical protein